MFKDMIKRLKSDQTKLPGWEERVEDPIFKSPKTSHKEKAPNYLKVPLILVAWDKSSDAIVELLTTYSISIKRYM